MAAGRERLAVWDPQADWIARGCAPVADLGALARLLRANLTTPARVAFRGRAHAPELFNGFCQAVRLWAELEPACIVIEELAWVTAPGKAPAGWHELVTGGLKFGIDLVSITQRPSESDKTALSQATVVRCFQMERPADQKYMAGELGIDAADIAALAPLHYIEKNRRTRRITRGVITF